MRNNYRNTDYGYTPVWSVFAEASGNLVRYRNPPRISEADKQWLLRRWQSDRTGR